MSRKFTPDSNCDRCANTGILNASLVKDETGEVAIEISVCEDRSHSSAALAEKSVDQMLKTGLPVRVREDVS